MKVIFVAYTELSNESSGGSFRKHVISPVDTTDIPGDIQTFCPTLREQVIQHGVDPANLDEIVGIYDTYDQASIALSRRHFWRARS